MSYAISKDGSEIYYEIEGESEITLCWIYGAGGHIGHWFLQRPLSARYKMIYVDLGGHGKSKTKRSKFTMQAYGEDVAAVIESEELNNVILIGFSMGGPIILEAARLLTKKVIGLIGIDTFFPVPGSMYMFNNEETTRKMVDSFREDTPTKIWELYEYHMNNGVKVPQEIQDKFKLLPLVDDHVFISEFEELCYWDVMPFLSAVTHPIKAIMSGLSVPEAQRDLFKPNIDAVYMEGLGHCLFMADPINFENLLHEIITEIKEI